VLLALDGKSFLKKIFVEFDFAKIEEENKFLSNFGV